MRRNGFTLIEVLIALAVLAIALAAAMKATTASVSTAETLRMRTLAGWVAQNRLNDMTARGDFPSIGRMEGKAQEAGHDFVWHIDTGPSPNLSFRRVVITVYDPSDTQYALSTLVSYLANAPH